MNLIVRMICLAITVGKDPLWGETINEGHYVVSFFPSPRPIYYSRTLYIVVAGLFPILATHAKEWKWPSIHLSAAQFETATSDFLQASAVAILTVLPP
jgi:hypothetical protein